MPEFIKDFVDELLGPTSFFVVSIVGFWAMIQFRRFWTQPLVFGAISLFAVGFYALSLTDADFVLIVGKPDNIPITILFFSVGLCAWVAFRKMVINDDLIDRGLPPFEGRESNRRVFCWPDLVYSEFLALIVCTVLLTVWAYYIKAPLEEPAATARTPDPSKAPWYFLGLQEMLVYYDPWLAGVVFPSLIVVGLMAIPYIDMNPKGSGYYTFKERSFAISVFLFGFIILWVLLIILGTFLRGPGWNFFGPFEYWDPHFVEALINKNISQFVWNDWLEKALPSNILLREAPGIVLVILYFTVLPPLLANFVFRKMYVQMGFIRFAVMAQLFLWMFALPLKMALRWIFNLKYIVAIPEYFFNI